MKRYDEAMYWMENEDWYRVNYEKDRFELTQSAPPKAVDSFKLYMLRNDYPIEEMMSSCNEKQRMLVR